MSLIAYMCDGSPRVQRALTNANVETRCHAEGLSSSCSYRAHDGRLKSAYLNQGGHAIKKDPGHDWYAACVEKYGKSMV